MNSKELDDIIKQLEYEKRVIEYKLYNYRIRLQNLIKANRVDEGTTNHNVAPTYDI